uniref:CHCH domain-containing protein n=1 Tax=Mesocestoides corti TaxID=53468 RepID=A0A0R3UHX4_MESCO
LLTKMFNKHFLPKSPNILHSYDEEEDEVIKMIKRTGCLNEHNDIMECMFEHKDWRKCQDKVKAFRTCMSKKN